MKMTWTSALLLALAGCAASGPLERKPPPEKSGSARSDSTDLAKRNDEELFALGTAASAAGNFTLAAEAFGRLADAFPQSAHWTAAQMNAGLALEQLGSWEDAALRFSPLANPGGDAGAVDATFHLAEALYHLERYPQASRLLAPLMKRPDLPENQKLMAQVQAGICQLEGGDAAAAETLLRDSVTSYQKLKEPREVDLYYPAQASFFLGELYRQRYEAVEFQAHAKAEKLREDLEAKAELLLSAEGHYLRTIRMGHPRWATAAGLQIGSMYEDLFQRISRLPDPEELRPDDVSAFRREVRLRVRGLLTKAISVYESTLEMAERTGETNPFVDRTKEGLKRMKDLLLTEDASDGTPSHS
jgi:tetratricopeptide (TPR) repeat protein